MGTQTISNIWIWISNNDARYKKRELKDSGSNAYMFRSSSHYSTSPLSHRRISTMSTGPSIKRPTLKNYDLTLGVHNSSLKHSLLHKRWTLSQAQSKEEIKFSDPMITNSLGDLERPQIIFLTK